MNMNFLFSKFQTLSIVLFSTFLYANSISAQIAIDTIMTPQGTMLVYANRTWEYLEDKEFDGIMNDKVFEYMNSNPDLDFFQSWDNDMCYTSDLKNDLSKLKDTLWLCTTHDAVGDFHMPFDGVVTSRYGFRKGRYHNGIDINLETGDTVRATWGGKVRYAKFNEGGFGNLVIIRHPNGLETFYAHLSAHLVAPNQEVKAGEPIGLGGNTGHSFGSHLHFEVRFYDAPMNPEELIDFDKQKLKDENLFVTSSLFRPGAKPTDSQEHGETITAIAVATSASAKKYYKVRSGDTLSAIAARNHTSVSALCKLNGIRATSVIQAGRNLRIK